MEPLFVDLAKFIDAHSGQTAEAHANGDRSSSKKRKLDASQGTEVQGKTFLHEDWNTKTCSSITELSFSIPQRKKLTLEIGSLKSQGVRARNPSTGAVEFGVSYQDIRKRPHLLILNRTLNPSFFPEHVICLPVPEKAQAQYNFCLFPLHGDGVTVPSEKTSAAETMLWTAGVGILDGDETYKGLCVRLLNEGLRHFGQKVVEPDEKEFVSQESRPYKTGEKAAHVKAFRGSKDGISSTSELFRGLDTADLGRLGFLYFLPNGIAWVFKKPLAFFGFDSVVSVSYTSVLQRTFNLNIVARTSTTSDDTQEFEFSMVDQSNFDGIDSYIKRHRLQDASMADQRRAKRLGINDVKGENDTHSGGEEEIGHLEKAAREAEELEDEDSEEDENFDPGSEGESEGSGSSSNEEEDNDETDIGDGRGDSDLVQEELGSEAEDIDED